MATTKVMITLDNDQLALLRELVATGKLESVSSFVRHAVVVSLADMTDWGAMLRLALEETGGPLRAKERAWADSVLQGKPKRKRKAV